jgi:hypothetical protein
MKPGRPAAISGQDWQIAERPAPNGFSASPLQSISESGSGQTISGNR